MADVLAQPRPAFASGDKRNRRLAHSVFLSKVALVHATTCHAFADGDDLVRSQPRLGNLRPLGVPTSYLPVSHIAGRSAQAQVPDVDAAVRPGPSVARMEHKCFARVTVGDDPDGAGRIHLSSVQMRVRTMAVVAFYDDAVVSGGGGCSSQECLQLTGPSALFPSLRVPVGVTPDPRVASLTEAEPLYADRPRAPRHPTSRHARKILQGGDNG